jgi:tetratricopeptide (TPR) repeat protein
MKHLNIKVMKHLSISIAAVRSRSGSIIDYNIIKIFFPFRFNDLPMAEQAKFEVTMKTVTVLHSQAKELFAKKRYNNAIKNYQQSMNVLGLSQPKDEVEEAEIKKMKILLYTNLAVCYCKIEKPKYVFIMCQNIDRISNLDNHCKALFYCGKANEMLGKHELALKYYKKALKLEPKNREIGKVLASLDNYIKTSEKNEKELWQNAFESGPKKEKDVYEVDEDFQNGVRGMCEDLAGREQYAKIDLPMGLTKDEVSCIKSLISDYEGMVVLEDGEGKKKKISIVKKS